MDGFHDIGPIARAGCDRFTAVGDDDGLRLRVGFVEGEEEAEALLGFDGVRAGGGVGRGAFHGGMGDVVVDRRWRRRRCLCGEGGGYP